MKKPGFAAVAVLTLGLGIGANTAIFTVVNAVLIEPLPYPEPDRLVMLWEKSPRGIEKNSVSPPTFVDFRDQSRSWVALSAFYASSLNLTGAGEPERVRAYTVSHDFFDALGAKPRLGRPFLPEEGQPGADGAVVLSHAYWLRRFGGSPEILGTDLALDGQPYRVVGITPPEFDFPSREADLWRPIRFDFSQFSRHHHFLDSVGRLRPGVGVEQARAELVSIAERLAREYPDSNKGYSATLVPLKEHLVGEIRPALLVFSGAVGLILLIACANVANLMLSRGQVREKEIAIRLALGANRIRLVRLLLAESSILSLAGGCLALLIAWGGVRLIGNLGPEALPRFQNVQLDGAVLAFAFGLSCLTGILFGLAPALRGSRPNLTDSLKEAGQTGFGGRFRLNGRKVLIVGEVALSLLLLAGAGLLVKSFVRLLRVDPGFRPENVLALEIELPGSKYREAEQRMSFFSRALERLERIPDVRRTAAISTLPLQGGIGYDRFGFTREGETSDTRDRDYRFYARWISPDYFRTMGIPLLRGRDFNERDRSVAPAVVIIDEQLASRYFPGEDPLGKRILTSYAKNTPRAIVGVVGRVRQVSLDAESSPHIYIPLLQESRSMAMALIVGTDSRPETLVPVLRNEIWAIDKDQPIHAIRSMVDVVSETLSPRRLNLALLAAFALLAVMLAAAGIYGVVSYSVSRRTHEIGIRVALGARKRNIFAMVLGEGLALAVAGVVIGLCAAYGLTRLLDGLLFEVQPTDLATHVVVSLLLVAVALLASYVPARRATRVDPLVALRHE